MNSRGIGNRGEVPTFAGGLVRAVITWFVTLLGIIGGSITIYTFVDKERSLPLISLGLIDSQCLTRVASVPNLCCNFSFNNREVNNLWVSKIRLMNECKRNVIGLPGHDLMYSALALAVSNDYKVIKAEIEAADFPVGVDNDDKALYLSFEKWRPNQVCIVKVYSEGMSGLEADSPPRFYSKSEPFTQGEMRIFDHQEVKQAASLISHLPYCLTSVVSWVGIIGYGIAFATCVLWFIGNWIVMIKRARWNKMYYVSAIEAITKCETSTEGGGNIDMMPMTFWVKSNIPRPPSRSPFLKGIEINWCEIIGTNIVIVTLLFFFAIPLAALIYM